MILNYLILFSIVITLIFMVKIERTQNKINTLQAMADRVAGENMKILVERVTRLEKRADTESGVIVFVGDEQMDVDFEVTKSRIESARQRRNQRLGRSKA